MKKVKFLFLLTIGIICQLMANPKHDFGGVSVATADNVDATTLNPSGLGVNRGNQSVFFIPITNGKKMNSVHSAERYGNFGYSLYYQEGDPLFSPYAGSIGIGTSISRNFYIGASWNNC